MTFRMRHTIFAIFFAGFTPLIEFNPTKMRDGSRKMICLNNVPKPKLILLFLSGGGDDDAGEKSKSYTEVEMRV